MYLCVCIYIYTHLHTHTHTRAYVYTYICTYKHITMYISWPEYKHPLSLSLSIYIYIYIYTHTYTNTTMYISLSEYKDPLQICAWKNLFFHEKTVCVYIYSLTVHEKTDRECMKKQTGMCMKKQGTVKKVHKTHRICPPTGSESNFKKKGFLSDHYGGKNDRKSWTPTVFQARTCLGLRFRLHPWYRYIVMDDCKVQIHNKEKKHKNIHIRTWVWRFAACLYRDKQEVDKESWHINRSIWRDSSAAVCTCAYVYVSACIYAYVYVSACIYAYVYVSACIYAYSLYMCVCVCM
jgi:hypothetical protein